MIRFLRPLIGLAALSLTLPAGAEVAQKDPGGFAVHHSLRVSADVWATWSALTAPAKWWDSAHTWSGKADNLYIDSQATGCFCELMPVPAGAPEGTRRGSVEHMHIVNAQPGKLLRMRGALGPMQGEPIDGVLTIAIKPGAKGTEITWDYVVGGYFRMKPDDLAPMVDMVLGQQVHRLGAMLGEVTETAAGAESKPAPQPPVEEAAKSAGKANDKAE